MLAHQCRHSCSDSFTLLQQTRTSSSANPYSFIARQNSSRKLSVEAHASRHRLYVGGGRPPHIGGGEGAGDGARPIPQASGFARQNPIRNPPPEAHRIGSKRQMRTRVPRTPGLVSRKPVGSIRLTGSPTTYRYRFVSPPPNRSSSAVTHLPIAES